MKTVRFINRYEKLYGILVDVTKVIKNFHVLNNDMIMMEYKQITKLVLVPLEEWKRLNKNGGGGDTYTTIEIPSSKPRNQEGRGKNQEEKEELNPPPISHHPASWDDEELGGAPLPPSSPPPSPSLLLQKGKKGKGRGGGKEKEGGELKLLEMLAIDLLEKEF